MRSYVGGDSLDELKNVIQKIKRELKVPITVDINNLTDQLVLLYRVERSNKLGP